MHAAGPYRVDGNGVSGMTAAIAFMSGHKPNRRSHGQVQFRSQKPPEPQGLRMEPGHPIQTCIALSEMGAEQKWHLQAQGDLIGIFAPNSCKASTLRPKRA